MRKTGYLYNRRKHSRSLRRPARAISWWAALRSVGRQSLKIDRSQLAIARTVRSAIGFCLPLIIGLVTGHFLVGVAIAGGAASLGATGLSFTYQARTRTMLLAALGLTVSALIGGLVGHVGWLVILVVGLWGFAGGLMMCLGQPAMIIGLESTVALIVLAHFAITPQQAFYQAGLLGAGALLQTLLAIIPFPHQRADVEHSALASVYRALSDYAEDAWQNPSGTGVNEALVQAENTLNQLNPRHHKRRAYARLLEEGEYIRLELIILSGVLQALKAEQETGKELAAQLNDLMHTAATVLRDIAHSLDHQHGVSSHLPKSLARLEAEISKIQDRDLARYIDTVVEQAPTYCDILYKHLRDVADIVNDVQAAADRLEQQFASLLPSQKRIAIETPLQTLRANLSLNSMYFRHALRMGLSLAVAVALYQFFPQIVQRGYWIPLTVLLVLKPEFSETFSRGISRMLGTVVGIVLTTLVVTLLKPNVEVLIFLDVLVAFLAFSLQNVNYALFSCFITAEVVLLLTFVDPQPVQITLVRLIDTIIGGVLAMLAYTLWPSWSRIEAPAHLAERLETLRWYFVTAIDAFIHPSKDEASKLRRARHAAQSARLNAEISIKRSFQEPEHMQVDQKISRGLLTTTDDLARAILALEGYVLNKPARQPLPMLAPFLNEVDAILRTQVMILRDDAVDAPPPKLRGILQALEQLRDEAGDDHQMISSDLNFVLTQARVIVESVNTISDLLATKYHTTTSRLPAVHPLYTSG